MPHYVLNNIRLNPGISKHNYIASQLHYMIMVFAFGIADSLQPLILLHKDYYHIDKDRAGSIMSWILFLQLATKMVVTMPYGFLIDKLGRKAMVYYGALNIVAGFLIVPMCKSIYPGFIIAKILISNGSSALITIPLTADYIHDESKGRASGINITLTALGAAFSNVMLKIFFKLNLSLGTCYYMAGALTFILFMANSIGLKGGTYYLTSRANKTQRKSNESFSYRMQDATKTFFGNPYLKIALVLRIVGNADFYIAFTILSLYIKSLFPAGTDENAANLVLNHVQSFVFGPAFICNIIYGHYMDKSEKVVGTSAFALILGAIAFSMTSLVTRPDDILLNIAAILMGISVPGVYVVSTYLTIKHFPEDKRGMMMGVLNIVGYIGYVIIASGGGFLYDNWRKDGPFLLYSLLLLIALAFIVRIYVKNIKGN